MEFDNEHNEIIYLTDELNQINIQCMRLKRAYEEAKLNLEKFKSKQETTKIQIKKLTEIIESGTILKYVENIEGVDTLTKEELTAIYTGIDKTDYNEESHLKSYGKVYPRFIDLERVVKDVINFKKLYPGWILEHLARGGQYDTMPPETYYKYTYKTPQGHYMSHGGIEVIN